MADKSQPNKQIAYAAVLWAALGYTTSASALEFGELTVRSHLNQPLDATIVLDHLSAKDRGALEVDLASSKMFERFGIRRAGAVDRVRIETRIDTQARQAAIHLTTRTPVREPFVELLIQARTGDGRALREYTAMLDPAEHDVARAPAHHQVVDRVERSSYERQPRWARSKTSPLGGSYRVRAGDTLWSIARANTPHGATVAQTMVAIFQRNPKAFNGQMRRLLRGSRLTLPTRDHIRVVAPRVAERRVAKASTTVKNINTPAPTTAQASIAASGQTPPETDNPVETARATSNRNQTTEGSRTDRQTSAPAEFGQLSWPNDTPWPQPKHASSRVARTMTANETPDSGVATDASQDHPQKPMPPKSDRRVASVVAPIDVAQAPGSQWLTTPYALLLALAGGMGFWRIRRTRERRHRSPEASATAIASQSSRSKYASVSDIGSSETTRAETQSGDVEAAISTEGEPILSRSLNKRTPDSPLSATEPAPNTAISADLLVPPSISDRNENHSPSDTETDSDTSSSRASEVATDDSVSRISSRLSVDRNDQSVDTDHAIRAYESSNNGASKGIRKDSPSISNEKANVTDELAGDSSSVETFRFRSDDNRDDEIGTSLDGAFERETVDRIPSDSSVDAKTTFEAVENDATRNDDDGYHLEMIDPGEFDLYDPPSKTDGFEDNETNDSVAMRLELARMYRDMDDREAARDLLGDVCRRGDDTQRRTAQELLDSL